MIISIEGNIGSGKSTFVNILKRWYNEVGRFNESNPKIVFVDEPVKEWETIRDEEGETMLEKFYKDKQQYSFAFQMMAYITRLNLLKKAVRENPPDTIIITERCNFTDKEVFAKMLYDDKMISSVEYQIYTRWFTEFLDEIKIGGYIYIQSSPDISYNRVIKRSRKGETIPLEYLDRCNTYHNNWLHSEDNEESILTFNANIDKKYTLEDYNDWITYTLKYITKLSKSM